MLRSPFVVSVATAVALGPASFAAAQFPGTAVAIRHSYGVAAQDGILRGGGADYRVVFDRGGMAFTPALGTTANKTHTLRFTLENVRRGDQVVHDADQRAVARVDGNVVTFARGAVTERYEVRADGVEQSFVLDRPLGGTGDLVISGRIDTELTLAAASGSEVRFAAEGLGGVRIGAVVGIDANGRRVAGELHFAGEHLDLSLPASFVDVAAFPLVVDPLIGADLVVANSNDTNPDAAFDETNAMWLVAWQRNFSAGDAEVRAQRLDLNGNLLGPALFLSATSGIAVSPTTASVNLTDRFLVAWQQAPSALGGYDIAGCAVNTDGTFSATVLVANGTGEEVEPEAASEVTTLDDEALLIWWEPGRVRACQVTLPAGTGAPLPIGHTTLHAGLVGYGSPRITKSGGGNGWFAVVWHRAPWVEEIAGLVVDRNLTPLTPVAVVSSGNQVLNPSVDGGDGAYFLVGYERRNGATGTDIACRRMRYDATPGLFVAAGTETVLEADAGDEKLPAVAFLGEKYFVAWVDDLGLLSTQIKLKELDPNNCAACGPTSVIAGTRPFCGALDIAKTSGNRGVVHYGLVVFSAANNTLPFTSSAEAQLTVQMSGGGWTTVSPACGQGGFSAINGPIAIGNRQFAFGLTNSGPAAAALLVLNAPTAPIPCGSCAITPPLISVNVPLVPQGIYDALLPVPIPCDLALVGGTIESQWWLVGTPGTPCPILQNVSFSSRLHATVGF